MKTTKFILILGSLFILLSCQNKSPSNKESPYITDWHLNVNKSQFSFVTVKNKTHNEEHSIKYDGGYINQNGELKIHLALDTVDTGIEIRDQRLRDILFEVNQFPVAIITAKLENQLPLLKPFDVNFNLDLHGISKNITATVLIQTVGDELVVTNFEPIVINGKEFNLDSAINQLTKIAGLQSINYEVLADFKLTFEK